MLYGVLLGIDPGPEESHLVIHLHVRREGLFFLVYLQLFLYVKIIGLHIFVKQVWYHELIPGLTVEVRYSDSKCCVMVTIIVMLRVTGLVMMKHL